MKNKDKYELFIKFNNNIEIFNILPKFCDDFGELLEGLQDLQILEIMAMVHSEFGYIPLTDMYEHCNFILAYELIQHLVKSL